jgi:hypothetical protein
LTQVAWITFRFLPIGLVAETSLVPLVTIDNGECDQNGTVPPWGRFQQILLSLSGDILTNVLNGQASSVGHPAQLPADRIVA